MLTDYHTHTYRCGHATGSMAEYVESAIEKGIGEIGLTDHLFLYFEKPENRDSRWAIAEGEYEAHYAEMLETREKYRGQVNVRVAVEADYYAGHEDELARLLAKYQFDFVLGSVHFMDGWLIDDPEQSHRYLEERIAEVYRRYFANLQRAVRLNVFDVLAHFDLPKKFGYLPEEDISQLVGETLDLVKKHDLAIEVSSAGLRKPVGEIYPSPVILREMKKRDIPIVLSSDAHAPSEVGAEYDKVIPFVRSAGYDSLVTFDGRKRSVVAIG
jgi:histidinol-phosphatase (PHP family)